ncbi:tripartite motif-containing protein 45-like [Mya arenaria]|uniref:tripartite motif-containing protein 45-like n=1 Tax=Mya arenaria TaxID=6604 RepID=UPI0022DEB44D|nr:tripartite motif-containing protein 45-like [Mya arenaria]
MEVPGKKLHLKTSAVDTSYCQPCSQDGDTFPAEAYCTVCKEFLCSNCASVHKKLKMTRSHALLDKSNMPTSMSGQDDDDEYIEPCEIHPKEFIKYFCPSHQTLNCGHCVVQNHRSCHVDVISNISLAFKDGPEYGDIDKAIAKLFKDIDKCASDVEKNKTVIAEIGDSEVSKLRRCRDEVNKYFDERENALLKLIEQMKNIDEALLDNLRPKCDNLKAEVEEIKNNLKTQENNTIQLFIGAKRAKQLLEITQTTLAEINKQNTIHQYRFNIDSATERLMESTTGLGVVKEEVIDTQNALGIHVKYFTNENYVL